MRVVAPMEVDVTRQRAVLPEKHPTPTTGRITLIVAVPGEVDGAPAVPLSVPLPEMLVCAARWPWLDLVDASSFDL